jgi:hypothetical protein
MATVTPNYSWPVPTSTDLVKDGASAIEALGDAIDATVFGLPGSGLILINTTTFSAVASQSVNNVFTSTYDNYKMILDIDSSATNPSVNMRLRVGGVDNSASNYWNNRMFAPPVTSQGATSAGTSFVNFGESETGTATFVYDIFSPFKTAISRVIGLGEFRYTSFYQHSMVKTGQTTVTTSYDGFSLITTAGTITGSVRIYGYNQ